MGLPYPKLGIFIAVVESMKREHSIAGRVVNFSFSLPLLLMLIWMIWGCSGPEEKKALFFKRATESYAQGDLSRALIEIKNALLMDSRFAEAHLLLARIEIGSGKICEAFSSFSKAADINPQIDDAQIGLGKIFLITGSAEKALEKAEFVLERNPRYRSALFLKGAALLAVKDVSSAVKTFEELIGEGVTRPEAYLLLGMALAEQGDLMRAENAFAKGIATNPGFAPLRIGFDRLKAALAREEKAESDRRGVIRIAARRPEFSFDLVDYRRHSGRVEDVGSPTGEFGVFEQSSEAACEAAARLLVAKKDAPRAVTFLEKAVLRFPDSIHLRVLLSELLFRSGRREKAIEILEACPSLAQEPFDSALLKEEIALARTHFLLSRPERAELILEEVLQANPRSKEGLLLKGDIHLFKGEALQAISTYGVITAEQPHFIPARIRLATAHGLNGELDLAVQILQEVLQIDPVSREALLAIARMHIARKDLPAAEAKLLRLIEAHPEDPSTHIALGDFLVAAGKTARAEEIFREMIRHHPNTIAGYLRLARLQHAQNRTAEAVHTLEVGYAANPSANEILAELVRLQTLAKNHPHAIALLKARLASVPFDPVAWSLAGFVNADLGQFAEAEDALRMAIAIQPLWSAAHANLARLFLAQGKQGDAIRRLEEGIAADPKNPALHLTLAQIHQQRRDWPAAIGAYERALESIPDLWIAANNLAFILAETGASGVELDRAQALAERALEGRPNDPAFLDTLGWVCYKKGKLAQARVLIEQAVKAAPEEPILNYHLAAVLARLGKRVEAVERLNQALTSAFYFHGRDDAARLLKELS